MTIKNGAEKIVFMSFGFKNGIPEDANYVFDMRFIPNPYYVEDLRALSGQEKKIQEFLLSHEITRETLSHCKNFINFIIEVGDRDMNIAFGCTGGRHRSVAFVEWLYSEFKDDTRISLLHRDIQNDG